jgi:hypothetical protein
MFTSSTKLFQSITPAGAAGYQIARSLRFNSADTTYLSRTPSAGDRQKWTVKFWIKRSNLGAVKNFFGNTNAGGTTGTEFYFDSSDRLVVDEYSSSVLQYALVTTQVFRDPSAFYDIQIAVDTTQATSSNRIKIWVNGAKVTAFSTATYPTQNFNTQIGLTAPLGLGRNGSYASGYFDGYMADVYFVDGQQLDATSFGQTDSATGVWVPKAYTGTFGTNGFWLKFDDNSGTTATTLGKDSSGNSNNWTPNNFSVTAGTGNDSLVDSPTNYGTDTGAGGEVRGNYATLNPLAGLTTGTLSNGNLDLVGSTSTDSMRHATIGIPSGKWYAEVTVNVASASATMGLAVYGQSAVGTVNGTPSRGYYHTGQKYSNGTLATYGNSFTNGDVIGIAVDVSNGKIWFSKNGTWQASGDPAAGTNAAYTDLSTTETWFLTVQTGSSGTAPSCSWNFGQRPFAYTAPSGFKALCTQNLPTPAIGATSTTLADDYFNIALYTGNGTAIGSGGKAVTGIGFQPDFVWIKGRSGATDHGLYDAVRGTTKQLESNTTDAETTQSEGLTTFGSDGFTVGSLAQLNTNTATYVGWAWKANGAGSSNTAGSITSTVSANTAAGVSVVTWSDPTSGTSYTIGHGLGATPAMIIFKYRNQVSNWLVYHKSIASGSYCYLNSTAAAAAISGAVSSLSSTTITLGTYYVDNPSQPLVAYCFAEVAGFSKFGSYTGNGSADGVFVYLGFRPRFIMGRDASGVDNWWIYDSARNTYNVANSFLRPNLADAEGSNSTDVIDFLSNGFKIRGASNFLNENGNTFIYAAFAEAPFNYSRAR